MDSTDLLHRGKLSTLRIREFRKDTTDMQQVQQLERSCDDAAAPPAGKTSIIFTNLELGDPLCRVRSYPIYCMMVAEAQLKPEFDHYTIVGVIRAGVKELIRPVSTSYDRIRDATSIGSGTATSSKYVLAMYISGLRVCCRYRRHGVAQQLVMEVEAWGRKHGAEYAYLATENDNQASVSLFTHKLGYIKFRSPSILVQPIYGKPKLGHIMRRSAGKSWTRKNMIHILKLSTVDAERLYRSALGSTEFFPKDIDSVLKNPLSAGTWVAFYHDQEEDTEVSEKINVHDVSCSPWTALLKNMEEGRIAWAMLSLWRYDKLIKFEVRGASARMRRWAALTRLASRLVPWVVLPCLPNVFDKAFGMQLMYGLHACKRGGGQHNSSKRSTCDDDDDDDEDEHDMQALMESLCWHAHNMALQAGCKAVVAEMGSCDPLKARIPHWPSLSEHDLWCVKRLSPLCDLYEQNQHEDWCKWPPSLSLFLDPRDF